MMIDDNVIYNKEVYMTIKKKNEEEKPSVFKVIAYTITQL